MFRAYLSLVNIVSTLRFTGVPINMEIKGILSVISSDPPCKGDNAQFKLVLLTALSS